MSVLSDRFFNRCQESCNIIWRHHYHIVLAEQFDGARSCRRRVLSHDGSLGACFWIDANQTITNPANVRRGFLFHCPDRLDPAATQRGALRFDLRHRAAVASSIEPNLLLR